MFERPHPRLGLLSDREAERVTAEMEVQQWRTFVRTQLRRLAEAGDFSVTAEQRDGRGSVLRYIVAPQGADGRSIVVPNVDSLLPPPELPPRATRDLLAPYTIQAPGKSKPINVPWSRVLRDHKQVETKPPNICLGCQWGIECAHGWAVPSPRSVIVLAVNDPGTHRQRLAWFVRFADDCKRLVQIPRAVAKTLTWRMENDMRMCTSSLCSAYALEEDDPDESDFITVAYKAYERIYTNIRSMLKRKREAEKMPKGKGMQEPDWKPRDDAKTCVVCLEDDEPATSRCKRESCAAAICLKCHHKTRGLCPICDRTAINADYPCSSCGQLARLGAYGFPCITCNSCTLCKVCYTAYEECSPCESAALA